MEIFRSLASALQQTRVVKSTRTLCRGTEGWVDGPCLEYSKGGSLAPSRLSPYFWRGLASSWLVLFESSHRAPIPYKDDGFWHVRLRVPTLPSSSGFTNPRGPRQQPWTNVSPSCSPHPWTEDHIVQLDLSVDATVCIIQGSQQLANVKHDSHHWRHLWAGSGSRKIHRRKCT